jgi:hypothetical protein
MRVCVLSYDKRNGSVHITCDKSASIILHNMRHFKQKKRIRQYFTLQSLVASICTTYCNDKKLRILSDYAFMWVDLGGLVVSVLATGPKVRGFRSTTSFGGEVKPSVPCRKRTLRAWIKMLRKPSCLHFSSKSPDCLPDGSGGHIRIDRTSAASWPVTNSHECARLSNLEKRRQEEARAHIGLLSHVYYYIEFPFRPRSVNNDFNITFLYKIVMPIPVAARSKAWVCDHLLTMILGSNPTGGMDVCLLCFVVR